MTAQDTPPGKSFKPNDPALAALGLRVSDYGVNNRIIVGANVKSRAEMHVMFRGDNNLLILRDACRADGQILFEGTAGHADLHGQAHTTILNVTIYDEARFLWGPGSVTYGLRAWVYQQTEMRVGPGCLFSEDIQIRTSDHHSIIDLDSMAATNAPADVAIQEHVWVGARVMIMKGVHVGAGAIIGAGSILGQSVGEAELWAGVPARRLRQRVSWVDSMPALPHQIEELKQYGFYNTPREET